MTMKQLEKSLGEGEYESPRLELMSLGSSAHVQCFSTGTESYGVESDDEEYLLLG